MKILIGNCQTISLACGEPDNRYGGGPAGRKKRGQVTGITPLTIDQPVNPLLSQTRGTATVDLMPSQRFITEGPVDYPRYRFGYCHWLALSPNESLAEAYEGGFLPYSGQPADPRLLFYMARSLRVDLAQLAVSKKRRYEQRTWESAGSRREVLAKTEFMERYGPAALRSAQTWMAARFGEPYLSADRLDYILGRPYLREVMVWTIGETLKAFALLVRGDWGVHYWFAFYRPGESLAGHGYLLDFLLWARAEGLPMAYLGTAYGLKSRYKWRGLAGIRFWSGDGWKSDREELARLQEADG